MQPMNTPEFVDHILRQPGREVFVQVADSGRSANGNTVTKLYIYTVSGAGTIFTITERLAKLLGYRVVDHPHGALSFPGDAYEFRHLMHQKFPGLPVVIEEGGNEF